MFKYIYLIFFILTIGCSETKNDPAEVEKFNQEHQEFLLRIKEMSQKVLNSEFDFSGLEVIYVQAGEAYYQWLGHVFLRFVGSGETVVIPLLLTLKSHIKACTASIRRSS